MKKLLVTLTALAAFVSLGLSNVYAGSSRDYISIVGSSTVYSFCHSCGRAVWKNHLF